MQGLAMRGGFYLESHNLVEQKESHNLVEQKATTWLTLAASG